MLYTKCQPQEMQKLDVPNNKGSGRSRVIIGQRETIRKLTRYLLRKELQMFYHMDVMTSEYLEVLADVHSRSENS